MGSLFSRRKSKFMLKFLSSYSIETWKFLSLPYIIMSWEIAKTKICERRFCFSTLYKSKQILWWFGHSFFISGFCGYYFNEIIKWKNFKSHRPDFNGQELELTAPYEIKICQAEGWAEKVGCVCIHVLKFLKRLCTMVLYHSFYMNKIQGFSSMGGWGEDTNILYREA